jgi:hypothetical protein
MSLSVLRVGVVGTLLGMALGCHGTEAPVTQAAPQSAAPSAVIVPTSQTTSTATPACSTAPTSPIAYGQCVVLEALARAKSGAKVTVMLATDPAAAGVAVDAPPESYGASSKGVETTVVGRDPAGAMYGALEIAERLDQSGGGALPLASPLKGSPALKIRAANLFLIIPEAGRP